MSWCFALINNRLAEIFFEERGGVMEILGHAYVSADEYDSAQEKRYIEEDTAKFRLVYRGEEYSFKKGCELNGFRVKTGSWDLEADEQLVDV